MKAAIALVQKNVEFRKYLDVHPSANQKPATR
jgi:hypothetical protein